MTSKAGVVDVGKVSLQVLSKGCQVEISSMNDEECYKGGGGGSGNSTSTCYPHWSGCRHC